MTRQSAPLAKGDRADVREVGLLRVAQVLHERAGRARPPRDASRPKPSRLCAAAARAACAGPLESNVQGRPCDPRRAAARRRRATVGQLRRHDDLARPQHGEFVGEPAAVRPAYSAVLNSPVDRSSSATPKPGRAGGGAIGHQERRLARVEIAASVSVPGDTTRTTSRRTSPLAFFGSSTCSQMATRKPFFTSRAM
jgi:hypothetical protein